MTFCSLKPQYSLRGWIGMPFALCCNGTVKQLNKKSFDALLLCDGQRDLDTLTFDIHDALHSFEKEGVVVFHKEPRTLMKEQYYHYYPVRFFRSVMWSVTGKCNFRCRHCYLDAPETVTGDLSTGEAFHLIDQMAECGIYRVELTGGEPFVREDFWQLVDHMQEHGIVIAQVYTNGWLLTEKVLDEFEKRRIYPEFSISLDGIGWHDWMRGIEGAEDAALKALQLCKEIGFSTNVEICIHKGNIGTLCETILRLVETGTRAVKCSEVMNTDRWLEHSDGNEMTSRDYYDAMLDYIPHFFEEGMPIDLILGGVVELKKGMADYWPVAEFGDGTEQCLNSHICGAARSSCYIAPNGRLLPCMPVTAASEEDQKHFPRVQDIGLKQALSESFYMQFVDRKVKDLLEVCRTCRECEYHLRCGGGCRAYAVMAGEKNLMGPDPMRCLMWKGGYLQQVHDVCNRAIEKYCKTDKKQGNL